MTPRPPAGRGSRWRVMWWRCADPARPGRPRPTGTLGGHRALDVPQDRGASRSCYHPAAAEHRRHGAHWRRAANVTRVRASLTCGAASDPTLPMPRHSTAWMVRGRGLVRPASPIARPVDARAARRRVRRVVDPVVCSRYWIPVLDPGAGSRYWLPGLATGLLPAAAPRILFPTKTLRNSSRPTLTVPCRPAPGYARGERDPGQPRPAPNPQPPTRPRASEVLPCRRPSPLRLRPRRARGR